MKIALLNDFKEYAGAEVSIQNRLKEVPNNLDVTFVTPGEALEFEKFDGFVLENVTRFTIDFMKNIVGKHPYIKVEHDYGYCLMRNQINCKKCDLACPIWAVPFVKEMYETAKVVISCSPAHMEAQRIHLSGWKIQKHDYFLPAVYKNIPTPEVERKKKTVCYLGTLRAYKGIYDIMQVAERKTDYHFDLAGRIGFVKPPIPKNVSYVGAVEDKWKFLASHEYFMHVPYHLDPCPLTVVEAILMGCKIVFNQNVGTISHPYHTCEEWKAAVESSGKAFWDKITQYFK